MTNDDGIESPGLWALVRAVQPIADPLFVVAPSSNQSAVGAGFTLHRELHWEHLQAPPVAEARAWHVNGTPADCVMIAMDRLLDGVPDLVVSGINQGANLGTDVLASGTVGGAVAAHIRGVRAVAFSATSDPDSGQFDWQAAERVASLLCRAEASRGIPADLLLNVNIPARPFEDIAGILVTRMGRHGYVRLRELTAESATLEREYDSHTHPATPPGTDSWALAHGYVSVSPLQTNLTNHLLIDHLSDRLNTALRS